MKAREIAVNGVCLPLDLDDLAVEARVQGAYDSFLQSARELDTQEGAQSRALQYVELLRAMLNEAFGRDDAADLLLKGKMRLSEILAVFQEVSEGIGALRTEVFTQAHADMAAVTAQAAKTAKRKQ